jgi:hypothetical protein
MRYQKIESKIWNDEKFIKLAPMEQRLFFYILTSPHGNIIGLYVLKEGYACEDLKCLPKDFRKELKILIESGLIKYDHDVTVVWIKNFLKHNPITNPNQVIAAKKILSELPKTPLIRNLKGLIKGLTEELIEGFTEGLLKPEPEPETETETETDSLPEALQPSKDGLKLSLLLLEKIKSRNGGFKNPNLKTWSKEIDLMITRDSRDPAEIEEVICWCQKDDFWKNNILSPQKLRKQYDQLILKMSDFSAFNPKPRKDSVQEWLEENQKTSQT